MSLRNAWFAGAIVLLAACRAAPPRPAEPIADERRPAVVDPREALGAVLDDLARSQGADGAWRDGDAFDDAVAATALAALALTRDRDPSRPDDEERVRNGVKWLVFRMRAGTWSEPGAAPVSPLVHALAATALAEGYGRSKAFLLRPYAQNAIDRAVSIDAGDDPWARGWRLVALSTAEAAGLHVPAPKIDAGADEIDELVRVRGAALDAHARGALVAIASICRSRAKAAARTDAAPGSQAPVDLDDASAAALDHAHFALRAIPRSSADADLRREEVAQAACALWNERANAEESAVKRDVAWRARLALCLIEAVSASTEPGSPADPRERE